MAISIQVWVQDGNDRYPVAWIHRTSKHLAFSVGEFVSHSRVGINDRVLPPPFSYKGHWTYHENGEVDGRDQMKGSKVEQRTPLAKVSSEVFEMVHWGPRFGPPLRGSFESTLHEEARHHDVVIDLATVTESGFSLYLQLVGPGRTDLLLDEQEFLGQPDRVTQGHIFTKTDPLIALYVVGSRQFMSPSQKYYS